MIVLPTGVRVLVATDAAGEGINLQRAHLMVNYDLPWNPNRIEQRFGRIHRIGQTEVCHLWNLVAEETREGQVYRTLLEKLEQARQTLGGQVFDVLGKVQFEGRPLRDLLVEAIRYGERPEVRARLTQVVATAFDPNKLQDLIEERALTHDVIHASRLQTIREEMERAEARRLQPHYIESFFLEAFRHLGGSVKQREPQRYEITHVPAVIRNRDRLIGVGEWLAAETIERAPGESVFVAALPRTSTEQGAAVLAANGQPLLLSGRQARPYPPGRVRINGQREPAVVAGDLILTWAHRDRTQQTAYLVRQDEGDIGPEPGTSYRVRIRDRHGNLVRSATGIAGNTWTWDVGSSALDAGVAGDRVTVEIEAEREGLTSWQAQVRTVDRAGYGLRWGQHWGGV